MRLALARTLRLALAPLLFLGGLAAAAQEPEAIFEDRVDVRLLTLRVQVVDRDGQPVPGLAPEDFRLRSGGREVPVLYSDWIDGTRPWSEEIEAMAPGERRRLGLELPPPGQNLVLFVQSDFNETDAKWTRPKGFLSFLPHVRSMLEALPPEDRVAVVSFDSHLRLFQDFTADREAAFRAVRETLRRWRPTTPRPPLADGPRLSDHWDEDEARRAAFVERGLELTAAALEPLPSNKAMIYMGWGVGHNGTGLFRRALRSLHRAGVVVHVLDIVYDDLHDLALPLANMASFTGGTYASTYNFPAQAWRGVVGALAGYYLLTLDGAALPGGRIRLRVSLRPGVRGQVLHPDIEIDAPAETPW